MTLLKDKHNIIIDMNSVQNLKDIDILNPDSYENISSFFENYILNNNFTVNHYKINYYFYKNKNYITTDFKIKVKKTIENILITYVKQERVSYRKMKHNLEFKYIMNFLDRYHNKLFNINKFLHNIFSNNSNEEYKYKWGTSGITIIGINIICQYLLCDNCIIKLIENNISETHDILKFINFIKNYISYKKQYNYGIDYSKFVDKIDEILVRNISNKLEYLYYHNFIDQDILKVNNFKTIFNYAIECKAKYSIILFDSKYDINYNFNKLYKFLMDLLFDIMNSFSFKNIIEFLNVYKTEIKQLNSIHFLGGHKIENILLDVSIIKSDRKFIDFIKYSSVVNSIIEKNSNLPLSSYINFYKKSVYKNLDINDIKQCTNFISTNVLNKNIKDNIFIFLFMSNCSQYLDLFMNYCEKCLIERIVYMKSDYDNENRNLNLMKNFYNNKTLFKYSIILQDLEKSNLYLSCINCKYDFDLIISSDIWNINLNSGNIDFSEYNEFSKYNYIFKNIINNCEIKNNNVNKYFLYHLHLGKVDMTYHSDIKSVKLIMLPIQILFFGFFEKSNLIFIETYEKVLKDFLFDYYEKDNNVISNIINSFLVTNIIKKEGDYYALNLSYDEKEYINLIEIYNDFANTEEIIDRKIKEELAHTKENILSTNIMHFIKKYNGKINKKQLYNYCEGKLDIINISMELMDSVLDTMIEKEYIIEENELFSKLLF